MMLSRLVLDPRRPAVRRMLGDVALLHARVLQAFPATDRPDARAAHAVLHRLDLDERSGALVLLVQSREAPDWSTWRDDLAAMDGAAESRSIRAELDALASGSVRQFRLRANATRRIMTKSGEDGARRHGKRVPAADPTAWVVRKLEAVGAEVLREGDVWRVDARPEGTVHGRRGDASVTFEATRFDGVLRVVDAGRLRDAVRDGIGSAKAYGFGLLSLRALG